MSIIRFDNVAFGYSDMLFKNVSLTITQNDRIGVVGNNGCGKSTLLKCIAGMLEPEEGRIISTKGLKFGFIEQNIPENLRELNLFDVISAAIPEDEKNHSLWKIDIALDHFKALQTIRKKPLKELSGGWQRLALIARMVLSSPDVLLLDEPTNHLDVAKIIVLEKWLNEQVYDIPLITVSHDRIFLANCTNKTLFLRGSEIHEYHYSYWRAKELLQEDDKALNARREKELSEINRLKRSAHDLRQMGINNYSDAALKKSVQIAKRAEGIEADLTTIHVETTRSIKLPNRGIQTKRLLCLNNIDIRTPDGIDLFHIDQLEIVQGERLIIFGTNGSGKSQFLTFLKKAIDNTDDVSLNGIFVTPSVKLGYVDQHLSHLPLEKTLQEHFMQLFSLGEQRLTSLLIVAGFPINLQKTKINKLSCGQRARAAFLILQLLQPNFYIMDEPTNHLDIAGQEQLEEEIVNQGATSVVVSHDRVFTENIGTQFFAIKNKKLLQINGPDVFYNDILYCK